MKALLFLARSFRFEPFVATIPEAGPPGPAQQVEDAVVAFIHCEEEDEAGRPSILRRMLKQIKWLAGKRGFRTVALHSFTHLSGSKATPEFALAFLEELAGRLQRNDYRVILTPFGYTCTWDLSVHGETLAKVFVDFAPS